MATLTGQSIASSYEQLLHVDRDGGGNSTTLVNVKDGDNGTTFALQLATDHIEVNGKLNIDQDANSYALVIDTEATTEAAIFLSDSQITTGTVMYVADHDALTTGKIANFHSDSSDNSTRNLVEITNHHASADNAVCLKIHQDGDDAHIEFAGAGGGGIKFNASAMSSSDANTLDDYEEGTWTPAHGSYYTSTGLYTKIGRLVTLTARLVAGGISAGDVKTFSSDAPFTCTNTNGGQGGGAMVGITANTDYGVASINRCISTSYFSDL